MAIAGAARADKIALVAVDQKTARAIVLKAADLGAGWHGATRKPDLATAGIGCTGLEPTTLTVVVTGAAETLIASRFVAVDSKAELMRTAGMLAARFRILQQPRIVGCLREKMSKEYGPKATIDAVGRVVVPHLAADRAGFRVVVTIPSAGTTYRMGIDFLVAGKGRAELTLMAMAPAAARPTVSVWELTVLQQMLARTPAS
jgi:hypothetical protein